MKHDCTPQVLLSIFPTMYVTYFKIIVSGGIDMDLFMKQRSKQAANMLIYHTVPHSHTIQSNHSLQMSSLLQKVNSRPHLSLFHLEKVRVYRHTKDTLHFWHNCLLLCTHTEFRWLYYKGSKMPLV